MSDLSPETRSLLARGRAGHSLPEGRRKGMKRALFLRIAGGSLVVSTTSASAMAAKVVAVAILVGAFGASVASVVESRSAARPPAPVRIPTAAMAGHAGAPGESALEGRSEIAPAASEAPVPEPVGDGVTGPATVTPAPLATTASAGVRGLGKAIPATTTAASRLTPTPDTPVASSVAPPVPTSAPSLQAEATLLLEAHQALNAGDPATALRLLGDHATRFPGSVLAPERSAERILALCRAGRTADAHQETLAFVAAHASGPLAQRVQRSCGGGQE